MEPPEPHQRRRAAQAFAEGRLQEARVIIGDLAEEQSARAERAPPTQGAPAPAGPEVDRHPIRTLQALVNEALSQMGPTAEDLRSVWSDAVDIVREERAHGDGSAPAGRAVLELGVRSDLAINPNRTVLHAALKESWADGARDWHAWVLAAPARLVSYGVVGVMNVVGTTVGLALDERTGRENPLAICCGILLTVQVVVGLLSTVPQEKLILVLWSFDVLHLMAQWLLLVVTLAAGSDAGPLSKLGACLYVTVAYVGYIGLDALPTDYRVAVRNVALGPLALIFTLYTANVCFGFVPYDAPAAAALEGGIEVEFPHPVGVRSTTWREVYAGAIVNSTFHFIRVMFVCARSPSRSAFVKRAMHETMSDLDRVQLLRLADEEIRRAEEAEERLARRRRLAVRARKSPLGGHRFASRRFKQDTQTNRSHPPGPEMTTGATNADAERAAGPEEWRTAVRQYLACAVLDTARIMRLDLPDNAAALTAGSPLRDPPEIDEAVVLRAKNHVLVDPQRIIWHLVFPEPWADRCRDRVAALLQSTAWRLGLIALSLVLLAAVFVSIKVGSIVLAFLVTLCIAVYLSFIYCSSATAGKLRVCVLNADAAFLLYYAAVACAALAFSDAEAVEIALTTGYSVLIPLSVVVVESLSTELRVFVTRYLFWPFTLFVVWFVSSLYTPAGFPAISTLELLTKTYTVSVNGHKREYALYNFYRGAMTNIALVLCKFAVASLRRPQQLNFAKQPVEEVRVSGQSARALVAVRARALELKNAEMGGRGRPMERREARGMLQAPRDARMVRCSMTE